MDRHCMRRLGNEMSGRFEVYCFKYITSCNEQSWPLGGAKPQWNGQYPQIKADQSVVLPICFHTKKCIKFNVFIS